MQQHDVNDTMTRKSDQGKAWPPNTPGTQEAGEPGTQEAPVFSPNWRKILKD